MVWCVHSNFLGGTYDGVLMPFLVGLEIHSRCRGYLPGKIGIRSLVGLPKTHMARESFVAGSVLEDGFLECINSNFTIFLYVSAS